MMQSSQKRVLVTGAGGFIGRHCLPHLLDRGYEVHAADLKVGHWEAPGLHWHALDLLDRSQTSELMASVRPTHLLHFGWFAKPGEFWHSAENLKWVASSLELIRVFSESGGQRVVMAGTCAEYDWADGDCREDHTPLTPGSLYGVSKNALRQIAEAYCAQAGLSFAWGRIFFLYGPHEHPDRLVSSIVIRLLKNQDAPCTHGNQVRDFLFVDDVASAFVALVAHHRSGVVNISSGQPVRIKDVARAIAGRLGLPDRLQLGKLQAPPNEPGRIVGINQRLTDEFNWTARYSLEQGIDEAIRYWSDRTG